MAQALAYARFRSRSYGLLGSIFPVLALLEVVEAVMTGFVAERIWYAFAAFGFALTAVVWLLVASRCRRGAQLTAQAATGR